MFDPAKTTAYRAIVGLSGMWWALAVLGLCALLAFVMFSLAPVVFSCAALFALIFGVIRFKTSNPVAIGISVVIFLFVLFGVPTGATRAVHADLTQYDRSAVAVSERIQFEGDLLVSAPPASMRRYFDGQTGEAGHHTLNLLLLAGELETITVSPYDPLDFDELRSDFGPDAANARTFGISQDDECQAVLQLYRDGFGWVAADGPEAQAGWRGWRETLAEDCIVEAQLPERFDWRVRYGVWRDAEARAEESLSAKRFGLTHMRRSPYRPYRAGVRVSFAEIIGPDDEPVFRAFNPRAHALAAPLQFDRGGWESGSSPIERAFAGLTLVYEETSLNAPLSREQSNRIPESLRYDFPIALLDY